MVSLQHRVLSRVLPLMARRPTLADPAKDAADMAARNRKHQERPPRRVLQGRVTTIANDAGFSVYSLERAGHSPQRSLFYLHGGSYNAPSVSAHWKWATRVADALDARLVFPTYPLAPEHTVDTSFGAMVEVFEQTAAVSPRGVILTGDSAGGGYALALAQALRDQTRLDRKAAVPEKMILIAPWVDLTVAPGTAEYAHHDPWLRMERLSVFAQWWAGDRDLSDPRVSPGLGDLTDLPPTLMFCGTRDLLKPGCDELFAAADKADWPMDYVVAPEMLHDYPLLPIPEAAGAFEQTLEFVKG